MQSSIGRAQGGSLAVHPLLLNPAADSAKYVPYTPRQRRPSTPPAVTVQSQLDSLRTAAQAIGLEPNSVGWAILDKVSYEGDSSDEWSKVWHAITKTKATLLLPSEPSSGHDVITPDFVQDHLVVCNLESRHNTALVTLSGLRGQLINDALTFRSTLHRSTKSFHALFAPSASLTASLDALSPLPLYDPESSYPSFTVSAFTTTLPFPSHATKPPLPPRPGVRAAPASSSARLSMPFASLFGQRPSTPPPLPPTPTTAPASAPASAPTEVDSTIDISALVINTALSRTDIATGIISALQGEIAVALNDQPPWIVERVHTFARSFFPFVKVPTGKKKLQDIGGNSNRVVYAVNGALDSPEDLAEKFQAFYRAMEAELRNGGHMRVNQSEESAQETVAEEVDDAHIRDILETIEATLCTLLYDRLFLPSTSDDASHNEALSSRIAALNMLDLGLEHLDIDIGDANHAGVDGVVRTCGQVLGQLGLSARSPRKKASVLVSAHKLVVEGLSKIPLLRLKSSEDAKKTPTGHLPGLVEAAERPSTLVPSSDPSPSIPTINLSTSPDRTSVMKPAPSSESLSPPTSTPVSGDVLLPVLIFSVVKANPSSLVSHLLFIQRFRNQSFGGEESYCLINLMAVAEFLENVDLGALGLEESEKVLSTADLTPISIARPNLPESPIAMTSPGEENLASLRGRVEQGVDAIAGSANKVITGVFDSSFGVLRALLPGQTPGGVAAGIAPAPRLGSGVGVGPGPVLGGVASGSGSTKGFSIAGLTVALPGGHGRARSQGHPEEEGQRELVEVTVRPLSLKSHRSGPEGSESEDSGESSGAEGSEQGGRGEEDGEAELREGEEGEEEEEGEQAHDTRSIKSFESMLSSGRTQRTKAGAATPSSASARRRKRLTDLTDRLTHGMAGMSRRVQGGDAQRVSTLPGRLPPPNRRFVECTQQDIRVSEVGELLREYQRLVEAVRSVGGFEE